MQNREGMGGGEGVGLGLDTLYTVNSIVFRLVDSCRDSYIVDKVYGMEFLLYWFSTQPNSTIYTNLCLINVIDPTYFLVLFALFMTQLSFLFFGDK